MKKTASLSVDLDNHWSYLKTHGDPAWEEFPSYLDVFVPRVLKFLQDRNLSITFFLVGQDAALEKNQCFLQLLTEAGHEIGNHSFHHEPWMQFHDKEVLHAELAQAEDAIEKATGARPSLFRGPGFCLSENLLEVLLERNYQCDASTNPSLLGPLARAYYLRHSNLSGEELQKRSQLFGTWRDGLRSPKPHWLQVGEDRILEIPVTTMPWLKVPFHLSYVLYLSSFSTLLARNFFRTSLNLCRLAGFGPSLLLHPLDFLSANDAPGLEFFPAMQMPLQTKLERVDEYLSMYQKYFVVKPLGECAQGFIHKEKPSLAIRSW